MTFPMKAQMLSTSAVEN